MYVFCHVNDQVLTDEEGCVSAKGVMIRHDGIKKSQISRREPDGKEVFGQHSSSKGPVTGRVGAYKVSSLMAAMCTVYRVVVLR